MLEVMKRTLRQLWQLMKKPLRIVLAILMILIGVLGWIFPILPGWAFFVPGVVLLAPNTRFSRWVKRKAHQMRVRWARRRGHEPPEPLSSAQDDRSRGGSPCDRRRDAPLAPGGADR
jgi:hypothetical protein